MDCSLCKRIPWSTVSNAALRSNRFLVRNLILRDGRPEQGRVYFNLANNSLNNGHAYWGFVGEWWQNGEASMKCYDKWPVCTELKRQVTKQCLVSFIFHPRSSPGCLSYKDGRLLVGNFEKNPQRYQDPPLWAWLEIFSPLRGTNSSATQAVTDTDFFGINTLIKKYGEISCCGTFSVWTLQEVPNLLFNPCPFYTRLHLHHCVQYNKQYNFISLR